MITKYSKEELDEALTALKSLISKCEKAKLNLKEGTSQHTLIVRRIKAFYLSVDLIEKELGNF